MLYTTRERTRALVIGATLAWAAAPAWAQTPEDEPETLLPYPAPIEHAELLRLAETVRAEQDVPALAVAVTRTRTEPVAAVVGSRRADRDEPTAADDLFHFGSCTKAMTATLIALLVEDGSLAWDDRVLDVFPEHAGKANEAYADVMLRDLLTHRGGIVPATAGFARDSVEIARLEGTPREQREALVPLVLGYEPPVPPHGTLLYSNAAFGLAAAMAERRADATWEDMMHERVFKPFAMRSAGFGWPATPDRPDQPHGHMPMHEGLHVVPPDATYRLATAIAPAGDVRGTITDLACFARAHLAALRGEPGPLSAEAAKALHEAVDDDGVQAMGWMLLDFDGLRAHWHNGSAGTFFAWMTVVPGEDLAIVVATNSGAGEQACRDLTGRLLEKLRGTEAAE